MAEWTELVGERLPWTTAYATRRTQHWKGITRSRTVGAQRTRDALSSIHSWLEVSWRTVNRTREAFLQTYFAFTAVVGLTGAAVLAQRTEGVALSVEGAKSAEDAVSETLEGTGVVASYFLRSDCAFTTEVAFRAEQSR